MVVHKGRLSNNQLITSRLINLHLSVYISAYACTKSLIFLLAPIKLRGILNPNPKGILPNCNSRPVCTQTNIRKQIQDKQIPSDCWTSRVTSKSPPLTTRCVEN